MKCYADYNFYSTDYHGTSIPESSFPGFAIKASAYLDSITYGNITEAWSNDDRISYACCCAADELYRQSEGKGEITSESNHSVSRSYASSGKSNEQKLYDSVKPFLSNTGLLYGGIQ